MDATDRFSELVEDYVRYRPDYPQALLDRMDPACRVVELGAGTGILSAQLLGRGHQVTAVEPNGPTGLPDGCADRIIAAQAFHWFDPEACRIECQRLLVDGGEVFLAWNNRV